MKKVIKMFTFVILLMVFTGKALAGTSNTYYGDGAGHADYGNYNSFFGHNAG